MAEIDWYAEATGTAKPAPAPQSGDVDWYKALTAGDGSTIGPMPAGQKMPRPVQDTLDTDVRTGSIARSSLATDTATQIKRLSQSTGIPEQRFGVIDGNIVYSDEQGQIKRVTPSVFGGDRSQGIIPYLGETLERGARYVASGLGPAIPQAAGAATGVLMGPTPGSIAGAGTAATVADLGRQALDKAIAGEDVLAPLSYDYPNAIGHGLQAAGGQGLAVGGNALFSRNPMGVSPYDRTQAMSPQARQAAADLEAEARRRGVNLSGGQATDLRSLKVQERRLGRFDETADQMYNFARNQRETQVPAAVRQEIGQISPATGQQAITQFRSGAEAVVDRALDARNVRAKMLYEQALERPDRFWNEQIDKLMTRPSVKRGIGYAKLIAAEEGRDITVPVFDKGKLVGREMVPDWRSWDYIKRGIDRVIEENTDQFGRVNAYGRAATLTKKELLGHLDAVNPQYGVARAAYGQSSDAVSTILDGGVGALNKMEGMDRASLVDRFFSHRNIMPEQVAQARSQFQMAGKLDDWNAGLASWLSDKLDNAMKVNANSEMGNVPGKLFKEVWGDQRQQAIVKAALGDQSRVQSMERLMQVLNAASRSLPEGSPTATDLGAMSGAQTVSRGLQIAGKVMSPGTYLNLGDEMVKGIDALRTPQARIQLANALLSGNYDRQLAQLRMLSPTGERALALTSQILAGAGITQAGKAFPPADREPELPANVQ
jgi:hypothetical protein